MSIRWRIYCQESGDIGWKYEWSEDPITECPNNATHSVNANSVQKVSVSTELMRIPIRVNGSNSKTTRLINFQYSPSQNGVIRLAKAIIYKTGVVSSITITITDTTHRTELARAIVTNTIEENIISLGVLNNVPTTTSILEVNMIVTGGNDNSKAYVDELVLYS